MRSRGRRSADDLSGTRHRASRVRGRAAGALRGVAGRRLPGTRGRLRAIDLMARRERAGESEHAAAQRVCVGAGVPRRPAEGKRASGCRRSRAQPWHLQAAVRGEHGAVSLHWWRCVDRRHRPAIYCGRDDGCDGRRIGRRRAARRHMSMVRRNEPVRTVASRAGRRCSQGMVSVRRAAEECDAPGRLSNALVAWINQIVAWILNHARF